MTARHPVQPAGIHHVWLVPLLIFLAAFSVRLVYLNQLESIPTFNYPIMDEKYHVHLAQRIDSEAGLDQEPFYRAPLYPLVGDTFGQTFSY